MGLVSDSLTRLCRILHGNVDLFGDCLGVKKLWLQNFNKNSAPSIQAYFFLFFCRYITGLEYITWYRSQNPSRKQTMTSRSSCTMWVYMSIEYYKLAAWLCSYDDWLLLSKANTNSDTFNLTQHQMEICISRTSQQLSSTYFLKKMRKVFSW